MSSKIETKLLHYTGKAIADYNMVQTGDRVLLCLSGGKDSFVLVKIMRLLQLRAKVDFALHILSIDNGSVGWNREEITEWLRQYGLPFTIVDTKIAEIVRQKQRIGSSPCILCSRLRRGHIYTFAQQQGYNKVALGHHRDDLITTLLLSIFYNGSISSMPPKLITNDRKLIVIRPLCYCQEQDIQRYASEQGFPLSPKNICPLEKNSTRERVAKLIQQLAQENHKIPSNMLHALRKVQPSHLMDKQLWDFSCLEESILQLED